MLLVEEYKVFHTRTRVKVPGPPEIFTILE
jgi:hypothetical protein